MPLFAILGENPVISSENLARKFSLVFLACYIVTLLILIINGAGILPLYFIKK
jgi:hypothetical protein